MTLFRNNPLNFTLKSVLEYTYNQDVFSLLLMCDKVKLQYQFASAAERGFSPRAVIRSGGGCQSGGQLPAAGATVRAAVVSG